MDKEVDDEIYFDLYERLANEDDLVQKRKIPLTRMLKLSLPESEVTYRIIGEEMVESGQVQQSIFPFKKATIIDPHHCSAQKQLAEALFKLEREDEAFSVIKKALAVNSQDSDLREFLITTLEEKHRLEDLEIFTKEIVNMIASPTLVLYFYLKIAETLIRRNEYPQALVSYKKAFENEFPIVYLQSHDYGMALYHEGLFEEAIVQFEHVRRRDPTNKVAFNNIAHLHYCLGRVEKALEGFKYIIENGLEVLSTYANFILVLYHLDQGEKVINKYRNLLQPYVDSHCEELRRGYHEELRITQAVLQRENIDEKMKEFNTKKLKGISLVLSFLNESSRQC